MHPDVFGPLEFGSAQVSCFLLQCRVRCSNLGCLNGLDKAYNKDDCFSFEGYFEIF